MELCDFTLEKYIYGDDVPYLNNWASIRSGPVESVILEVHRIADHIIKGLIVIHDLGEVHRDLSPQNSILFCAAKLKCSLIFVDKPHLEARRFRTHFRGHLESCRDYSLRERKTVLSRARAYD